MAWRLLVTQPNSEFSVARRLTERSFPFHLFKRTMPKLRVAFPRYVFVFLERMNLFGDVNGVSGFVRCEEGNIAVIPNRVLDDLLVRLMPNSDDVLMEEDGFSGGFRFGDKVRITSGVFEHTVGEYQFSCSNGRSAVLVPILGMMTKTEIKDDLLEVVREEKNPRRRKVSRKRVGLLVPVA